MVFVSQTNKHSTQHREDISLHESHQQFKEAHEEIEENGDYRNTVAQSRSHLSENENQGDVKLIFPFNLDS